MKPAASELAMVICRLKFREAVRMNLSRPSEPQAGLSFGCRVLYVFKASDMGCRGSGEAESHTPFHLDRRGQAHS